MKLFAHRKSEQNEAAMDPWTLVHFSTGMAFGLMDISFPKALGAAIGYEIVEQYVERKPWGKELFEASQPESGPNAVVDVVAYVLGYWAASAWNGTEEQG